jgi:hypothetical protein
MLLLKKYWAEIMIVIGALMVLGYIKYLRNEIDSLEKDKIVLQSKVNEVRGYLKAQNMIIESNRVDYETRINRLPTVLHDINTKYKTQYETIYAWKDHNETHDCNSSMQYLNTYQF